MTFGSIATTLGSLTSRISAAAPARFANHRRHQTCPNSLRGQQQFLVRKLLGASYDSPRKPKLGRNIENIEGHVPDARHTRSKKFLALEGLVILISILAAFLLEGWRDDRELAREVSLELVSVGLELERNRNIVLAELSAIDRIVTATDSLLLMLNDEPDAEFVSVADSLAWLVAMWVPTLDPSLGAAEALISSGRLAQVGDPELRLGLAGLRDLYVDVAQEQEQVLAITSERLWPLFVTSPDVGAVRQVSREFVSIRQEAGLSPQEQMAGGQMPHYQEVAFPNGQEVSGVLNLKLMWLEAAIAELRPLLPHLQRLITLVDSEAPVAAP
jgi:hypothetical protein